MQATKVTAKLSALTRRGRPFEAEFLVDTGALDCLAPSDKLKAAGIKPEGRAVYELADGQAVEHQYGFARISFMGSETVVQVVFGPPDSEPILGVTALESVGIMVDPVTRTLRRLHAKPLK
jgi:clan AA aspartic protease